MNINRIDSYQYSDILIRRNLNVGRNSQQVRQQRDEYTPSRNTMGDLYPTYSKEAHSNGRKSPRIYNYVEPVKLTSEDRADIKRDSDVLAQKMIDNNGFSLTSEDTGKKEHDPNESYDMKKRYKGLLTFLEAVNKARVPLKAKEIGQKLEENNIIVQENEEFQISVDKTGGITVSGENEEKAKAIEDTLNDSDSMGWSLNYLTYYYSGRYTRKKDTWQEMHYEDYLRRNTNGEVSLADLSLENGKIIGLPPGLDELVNGTKPNMTEHEKNSSTAARNVLTKLLSIGIDNIPDLTTEMVYKNGELIIH